MVSFLCQGEAYLPMWVTLPYKHPLKLLSKPFIKESFEISQKNVPQSVNLPSPPIRTPKQPPCDNDHLIMTGRQDSAPVATVKAENFHKDLQVREDSIKKQEIAKSPKRVMINQKSSRPPMELYNPRKLIGGRNGTKVHFAEGDMTKKSSPPPSNPLPTELKSALKRSKSFTLDESRELENLGFEKDSFPLEYHGLIRKAVLDPNSLSCEKLMELVRLICCKAVEGPQYASPAALLCFSIIEKEHDHTFMESLQHCCSEWFREREKLLRTPGSLPGGLRRWTAYILFLTGLFSKVNLVSPHMQSMAPLPNSPMAHLAHTLQTLLYSCVHIILMPPSLHSEAEIDLLSYVLRSVGKQLEVDCPQKMALLVENLREGFLHPSVNARTRKILLEMIELHAGGWQFNLSQQLYYFPYTYV